MCIRDRNGHGYKGRRAPILAHPECPGLPEVKAVRGDIVPAVSYTHLLRMQKNVSARDMSLSLGQNNSYIKQIENKKALPSLQGLFYICEYFGITPQQFFDDGSAYPVQLADLVEDMKKLDAASLEHIAAIVKEMVGNK